MLGASLNLFSASNNQNKVLLLLIQCGSLAITCAVESELMQSNSNAQLSQVRSQLRKEGDEWIEKRKKKSLLRLRRRLWIRLITCKCGKNSSLCKMPTRHKQPVACELDCI